MLKGLLLVMMFIASGCFRLPKGSEPIDESSSRAKLQGLDPGAKSFESSHFLVKAYHDNEVKDVSELAERLYAKIVNDTGLNSFLPAGAYGLVVYAHEREYLRKTGMPIWSGGFLVGSTLYTYEGPQLPAVLAHKMIHLIFREYMVRDVPENRWIDEGLAIYEEQEATGNHTELGRVLGSAYSADWTTVGGTHAIPFEQMVALAPANDEEQAMGAWYLQVASVVRLMIEHGGRTGFSQFLRSLHDGRSMDDALRSSFPGLWNNHRDLEEAWLTR